MTRIQREGVGLLAGLFLLLASPARAQYWTACGAFFPCVITEILSPVGSGSSDTAPTIRQSDFYVVGWSVNWYTGQQPVSIWAEAVRKTGDVVRLNPTCPPETCIHWRLPYPQGADLFRTQHGLTISPDTGFAIFFWPPPPLETERIRVYTKDPWGPATVTYVFVHLVVP